MDRPIRTVVKSVTWQALGLLSMTIIAYVLTGSIRQGGQIAMFSAGLSVVVYILHERIWARVRWGRIAVSGAATGLAERAQADSLSAPCDGPDKR